MMAVQTAPSTRIIFVNRYYDPDESATSQLLTDLARGLVEKGFDVHVIASRQLYVEPQATLRANENLAGVQIHRIATTKFGRARLTGRAMDYLSFYLSCAVKLITLLRRNDVLVVKTDPPMLSIIAMPIAKLRGVRLINWQQDVFPEVAERLGASPWPPIMGRLLKNLRDASLRSAAMNILLGERMHEYLASRGVPVSKLRIQPNWADETAIRPKSPGASRLRVSLGLADHFVVCYSGNLGRAHEFDTLVSAAEALDSEPTIVFLIIGSGAKMEELKRTVAARALTNFQFIEFQPRAALEDSLAAADVHLVSLMPDLEGFIVPSKLYGILAAGRPVIFLGDADGETARVIARGQCGLQVDVGDSKALTSALRELAQDRDGRATMGLRAHSLFARNFTRERAVEGWAELIRHTASESTGR
jgi:glycosyltransferase involved in cell wall biosynthesis